MHVNILVNNWFISINEVEEFVKISLENRDSDNKSENEKKLIFYTNEVGTLKKAGTSFCFSLDEALEHRR